MRRLILAVCTFLAFAQVAEARPRPIQHRGWARPACTAISGPPSLRFIAEPGLVRKSTGEAINVSATAIAAGTESNVLYATFEGGIYESRDAGCTWTLRASAPEVVPDAVLWVILPARDRVYVQAEARLLRLTGEVLEIFPLPTHPYRFTAIAVDPASSLHLRGIASDGNIFDSVDGGATWQVRGKAPMQYVTSAEVSPKNLDRLWSATYEESFRSEDGGKTWTRIDFDYPIGPIESSPLDENVVWFRATDMKQQIMRLYVSTDGGRTITTVITEGGDLRFPGQMAAHVREVNVLGIGTNEGPAIVTTEGIVTMVRRHGFVQAIAWSPAGTLYFAAPDQWIRTD